MKNKEQIKQLEERVSKLEDKVEELEQRPYFTYAVEASQPPYTITCDLCENKNTTWEVVGNNGVVWSGQS